MSRCDAQRRGRREREYGQRTGIAERAAVGG